jgi:hypothetical protein
MRAATMMPMRRKLPTKLPQDGIKGNRRRKDG